MRLEVRIERLGAQGDGVADGAQGPLFVPFALPGERVSIAVEPGSDRADLIEVLEPSPDRVAPICPHFGVCGGCALQHLEAAPISPGSVSSSWLPCGRGASRRRSRR